jgi:WD40 repeat protein
MASTGGSEVRFWDMKALRQIGAPIEVPSSSTHGSTVDALAVSPDGTTIATGGYDGVVRFWRVSDHAEAAPPLPGMSSSVTDVVFSPDGRVLAASVRSHLVLWDLPTRQQIVTPQHDHTGNISLAFGPAGRLLATAADDGVRFWNLAA